MKTRPNALREITAMLWLAQIAPAPLLMTTGESGLTVEALATYVPSAIEILRSLGVADMVDALWAILRFWISALAG